MRLARTPSSAPGTDRRVRMAVNVALGSWFVATAISQHPNKSFDRLRNLDPLSLLVPNWRFFAPEPAQHDYHILHRVLTQEDEQTAWTETWTLSPRAWLQAVWFPTRRRDKGLNDVANELMRGSVMPGVHLETTVPFELLSNAVELRIRDEWANRPLPKGFQFMLARHTGHDEEPEPEYLLASPFIPLAPGAS